MDKSKEKKYVCKFCNKECPSGKSLGGHIRIHTNEFKVNSDSYNAKRNKRSVDQREQLCCRECGKGFVSLKALCVHMDCHSEIEKKIVIDNHYDIEASSSPTRKRFKKLLKQSNSESFTNGSSSCGSEIDQEDKDGAWSLMIMSRESSSFKKGVVNSLAESSDNNSVIVETKSSSGEEIKMFNVKNEVLEADKVAVEDQWRSSDDDNGDSDSDYFMNGPKKSESDISVDGSFRNTGFNRFRNSDEVGVKEGGVKYDLMSKSKSKSKRVFPSHGSGVHTLDTDSCADANSKIHRFSDSKSSMAKKASGTKNKSNVHECPFCFRVFKSGQALGGHKRTHSIGNQEHKVAETRNLIDLNIPALDIDE